MGVNLIVLVQACSHNTLTLSFILTSPGKKQQCFRSMCLPKLICSKVSRICRVSIMSDSHANGWFRRADSRLGICALIAWKRLNIWDCSFWNVEFSIDPQMRSSWWQTYERDTCYSNSIGRNELSTLNMLNIHSPGAYELPYWSLDSQRFSQGPRQVNPRDSGCAIQWWLHC